MVDHLVARGMLAISPAAEQKARRKFMIRDQDSQVYQVKGERSIYGEHFTLFELQLVRRYSPFHDFVIAN